MAILNRRKLGATREFHRADVELGIDASSLTCRGPSSLKPHPDGYKTYLNFTPNYLAETPERNAVTHHLHASALRFRTLGNLYSGHIAVLPVHLSSQAGNYENSRPTEHFRPSDE